MQPRIQGWWLKLIITAKGKGDNIKEKNSILLLPGHGFINV